MSAEPGRWSRWVAFVDEREPGTVLALVRIAMGLVVVGAVTEVWATDVLDLLWVDRAHGGVFELGAGNWLVRLLGGPTRGVVRILAGAAWCAGVLVAVGLGGRAPALVAGATYGALTGLNGHAMGGYDLLITNALWLLALGDASRTLSLDAWRRHRRWADPEPVLAIFRRLLALQILVVYGATGLQKASPVWTPFGGYTALYWVFQEPTWRRYDFSWTAWLDPLLRVATAVTWHWEVFAPLMLLVLWYRRTADRPGRLRRWSNRFDLRKPFLGMGVLLHLGILLTLNVGPFSFASLAYYPSLFRPAELAAWWERRRRPREE